MPTSPIVIVDDDRDDCDFIVEALSDLGVTNKLVCFENGLQALTYLKTTNQKTFLILSDVNMPLMNGLELKKEINKDDRLRQKSIPFVFLSTSSAVKEILTAYDLMVQGFFIKSNKLDLLKNNLKIIVDYWKTSQHPNSVN